MQNKLILLKRKFDTCFPVKFRDFFPVMANDNKDSLFRLFRKGENIFSISKTNDRASQ